MPPAPRTYGGKSADARRAERRAQLLAATRTLLSDVGWARTSVRAVCAAAGLADRYFYESFTDRDALLAAVFDEVAGEALAAVGAAVAAAPPTPRDRARAAVATFLRLLEHDRGVARVALFQTPDSPVVHRHRRQALRAFVALIVAAGESTPGVAPQSALDRELTAHALIGVLQELLIAADEGELQVSSERLVEHAAAIAEAVAQVSSAAPHG